jgi:stringent starvation protein A
MTLFSAPNDPWSHRTRIVLAEKGISIDIVSVEPGKLPEDLLDLNPYHSVPTLVDRDLVLYDSRVIIEYLDERFPHPPLMPVDPVTRAQFRLALYGAVQGQAVLPVGRIFAGGCDDCAGAMASAVL